MLTCGMYEAAEEFAYRAGLPGKSSVVCGNLVRRPRHLAHLRLDPTP